MNVTILSPLKLELDACLNLFPKISTVSKGPRSYYTSRCKTNFTTLQISFRQTGSGLATIALATEQAINDWQPAVVLLVGIAGSIKDAEIGDLVIAKKAYNYDAGKETPAGFAARPDAIPTTPLMLEFAQNTARTNHWYKYLEGIGYTPLIHYGPIASGDKVVASTDSTTYQIIKKHYNDTLAVEMESIGFAQACLHHPLVQCLNIRGISDRVDGKSQADAAGSQPKAAAIAAAFARGLLDELDPSQFNFSVMELKPLVNQIMELLLPILQIEAGKEISGELKKATNTTIREIWAKVKPLFIEELEEYKEDPDDVNLTRLNGTLRSRLKKDEQLQKELTELLTRSKATTEGQTIIQNSKNVISGSNIQVSGDFNLGDRSD